MLGIVGTIPDLNFPLVYGPVSIKDDHLIINGFKVPVNRGTPALIAAALKTSEYLDDSNDIYAFLAGDIGKGEGSRNLYKFLVEHLMEFNFQVLTFHYLQPDVDWHNRIYLTIEKMSHQPLLIADAGFMYAAKMSGQAQFYDFFTPDIGELAFLADEMAPHPFYTRGFILHQEDKIPDLIKRAYDNEDAAKYLLVKGKTDYIVYNNQVLETVDDPSFEAMEAIGGTGDTLTGLLTVLSQRFKPDEAAFIAAKANRWTGYYTNPTPATQVADLINKIPQALSKLLEGQEKR